MGPVPESCRGLAICLGGFPRRGDNSPVTLGQFPMFKTSNPPTLRADLQFPMAPTVRITSNYSVHHMMSTVPCPTYEKSIRDSPSKLCQSSQFHDELRVPCQAVSCPCEAVKAKPCPCRAESRPPHFHARRAMPCQTAACPHVHVMSATPCTSLCLPGTVKQHRMS